MTDFQSIVNRQPAPAVAGDFASDNPRASMVAGPGGLIAEAAGVTIGVFAWADGSGVVSNVKPATGVARLGFVAREGNQAGALITVWMDPTSNIIPEGLPVTLTTKGDIWGLFAAGATVGQKVFADETDGTLSSHAAGATVTGADETAWFVTTTAAAGELAKLSQEG